MQLSSETAPLTSEGESAKSADLWSRHPLLLIFMIAIGVRIVVAVLLTKYFSGSLVVDDQTYWDIAKAVANNTTWEWDEFWSHLYASTRTFSIPLAAVYDLFGPSRLAGQMLVAAAGSLSAVVVFLIARKVLPQKIALVPAFIMALLPSLVIWSSLVLKDAFVWTTLTIIALLFANAMKSDRAAPVLGWLVAIAAGTFALAYLRPHSLVVCCFALVLASWVSVAQFRWLKIASLLILLITVPWVRGFGPAGWTLISSAETITQIRNANAVGAASAIVDPWQVSIPDIETESVDAFPSKVQVIVLEIEDLQAKQEELSEKAGQAGREEERDRLNARISALDARIAAERATAQAILVEEYDPSRSVGVKHVARGLSVMLAEPYPWDSPTSPSFKMAQAETIVWYPVLLLALMGLLPAFRARRVMLFPLLVGGGALIVYALAEGNVGSAFRHRSEFTWVVALVAGFGVQHLVAWRRERATKLDQPAA